MTAALAAGLAVAVVLLVVLAGAYRGRVAQLGRERQRAQESAGRMRDAVDAQRRAEAVAAEADGRASQAERRLGFAERRTLEAEARASEAQQRRADIGSSVSQSLLALERVRLQREWTDVVGPGVPPPVPWDDTLGASVGTELAIIRETMGAPGELGAPGPAAVTDPGHALLAIRLTAEILRLLAREGGEMRVTVEPGQVVVQQEASDGSPPGLNELAGIAAESGAELSVLQSEGWTTVRLRLPDPL